jgi:response regulator RpfG family c-di-GMP phosphodiesterase
MQRYIHRSAFRSLLIDPGPQTRSVIQKERPAAIILEIAAHQSEGLKIFNAIKADPEMREIPTVVCSWQDEKHNLTGEKANAFLHMPVLYEDFHKALKEIGLCLNE